jgi:NAD(P)-dependent dehydrogenase (short-subunit alcohol dehydrogenase family)
MTRWTFADIPSQRGRLAVVTGASRGLGFEIALALAKAGADVILAARDPENGRLAAEKIAAQVQTDVSFRRLDLSDLASVAEFAEGMASRSAVDLLINNAGVMALPARKETADGFEMQFGTNYLGHFALTARLLSLLARGQGPRVVNLSSLAHRSARIDFDDLQGLRLYSPWKAYGQSKLAMLMFAFELQRRSDAKGWNLLSVAAHPGWARTELFASGPGGLLSLAADLAVPWFGQSAASGATRRILRSRRRRRAEGLSLVGHRRIAGAASADRQQAVGGLRNPHRRIVRIGRQRLEFARCPEPPNAKLAAPSARRFVQFGLSQLGGPRTSNRIHRWFLAFSENRGI